MRMSERTPARVLVAGIGNIFLGDDAFGVEVVTRLATETVPDDVRLLDVGTRSLNLAYEMADGGYETVILVDALSRGRAPGTLSVLEPYELDVDTALVDPHGIRPEHVHEMVRALGGTVGRVLVVGCEPSCIEGVGLSDAVAGAVEEAVRVVQRIVSESKTAPGVGRS
jgi:hydrogenase maturation protease